jgi:hypothetical protein
MRVFGINEHSYFYLLLVLMLGTKFLFNEKKDVTRSIGGDSVVLKCSFVHRNSLLPQATKRYASAFRDCY